METKIHPMIIFWLGVLTGALVVGLIFSYNAINSRDNKASILMPSTYMTGTGPTPWVPVSDLNTTTTITR